MRIDTLVILSVQLYNLCPCMQDPCTLFQSCIREKVLVCLLRRHQNILVVFVVIIMMKNAYTVQEMEAARISVSAWSLFL